MFQGALLLNPQNLLYFLSTPTSKQVKKGDWIFELSDEMVVDF